MGCPKSAKRLTVDPCPPEAGLPGNITDIASFQDTLKDKDVALGLRFEKGHLVLTVDLPRLKAAAGGDLAESRKPVVSRAARFLPD
jgi:hypothetical protein